MSTGDPASDRAYRGDDPMSSVECAFTANLNRLFTAALVGIARGRWVSTPLADDQTAARELMERHRFEVLPIDGGGAVTAYYHADRWNDFSSVTRREIRVEDVVAYDIPLLDVICRFGADRTHFFLGHGGGVVGLISLVNLNCRMSRMP